MSVSCYYSGRMGNCVYNAAMLLAYAKKHSLTYYLPTQAMAYNHFRNGDISVPFYIPPTGEKPINPQKYYEPDSVNGTPRYHDIPKMDNTIFMGYFQSFRFFDDYRDYVIEKFGFPYKMEKGMTSISVRRGDCVGVVAFPIAPLEYYQNAVRFMQEHGFNKFRCYSDGIDWCKEHFTKENFGDAEIEFSEGQTEMESYLGLQNCENNITARSTFSLSAAWMNRNPKKLVCVPTIRHPYWRSQNADLIPHYFHQIDFQNPE